MIELGSEVQDTITGLKGIVTSEHRYLHGCMRYGVQPKVNKDGNVPQPEVVDEPQLKVLKAPKAEKKKVGDTGGPRRDPVRTAPLSRR